MILPSKLFSYEESILPLLPIILREMVDPISVEDLINKTRQDDFDPINFLGALDCLYALGKIKFAKEGKLMRC